MKRIRVRLALAFVASAAIGGACSDRDPASSSAPASASAARTPGRTPGVPATSAPKKTSFLLLTLDTTRADHLGSYGYEKAHTPNLDRIAASGARFDRAYASVPYTLPSHASLFTGRHPPEHGIHINSTAGLPADLPTITSVFAANGYRTGAFVSAAVLEASYGLARGFDHYDDDLGPSANPSVIALSRTGDRVAESALAWLESAPDEPFFCWVHFYDPHASYDPPSPHRELAADPYDGEIAFMDAQIGRLTSWLDARDLTQHTLVIAAADHGEGLGEHGERTHGVLIYDSTMRVPLLVAQPGVIAPGKVITTPVELVDVFPTVCELLGFDAPQGVSGRSLRGALQGAALAPRPVYGESEYCQRNFGFAPLYSVAAGGWKYIASPRPELYEIAADPREERDRAGESPEKQHELAQALEGLRSSMNVRAPTKVAIDSDTVAALQGLGYAQGGGDADSDPEAALVNPREQIELIERFHDAIGLGQRGRFAEMIEPLQKVAAAFPRSVGFRTELGTAYMHVNRLDEAKVELDAALALDPDYYTAHYGLGNVLQKSERYEEALAKFEKTLELAPEFLVAHTNMVACLMKLARRDEALVHSRALSTARPANTGYRIGLASLLREAGQTQEMIAVLEEGLAYGDGGLRVYMAWELATNPLADARDGARAVALCEEVLAAGVPRDPDVLDTLAAAYAEAGRFEDAIATAEEAIATARARERQELADAIETRLALYRDKKPFRTT